MRIVRSPAKINLFLAVGPPDTRGYHPLRTLFQAISLSDWLHIETNRTGDSITCTWPDLPADNTVSKALRLLREFGDVPPLTIRIQKEIPAQSGLGGGSSNAAGILRAVNQFAPIPFSREVLHEVATAVGADVPFFLVGGRARGEGYGEHITPMEDGPRLHLLIVRPDVSCSTPEAYRALDSHAYEWREFPHDPLETYNDFERVMPCASDDFIEVLQLYGAQRANLSGSGSAVFGLFDSEAAALTAKSRIDAHAGVRSWVCHSLSRAESLG